ncbi:6-carboxytetrahydropterin synthase [Candidatus Microgenomates bacterium]|nr:MAG: 6-carboxytetrahydropterin synthase [Candidatus Microgenomates bacterium]
MTEKEVKLVRQMYTETAHRLMDYKGRCAHVHGHSWLWKVEIAGPVRQPTGFVMDFADLKQIMQKVIDPFDHALLLRNDDPLLRLGTGNAWVTPYSQERTPRLHIFEWNPTSENLCNYVAKEIQKVLSEAPHLRLIRVSVSETANNSVVVECGNAESKGGA